MVIKGACLSRIERRVESWLFSSSDSDVGGCRIKSDASRLFLNSLKLRFFCATEGKFRKGWGRCGCNVEVSENRKVIRYSDKRL